jgi:hypothetical protein
MVQYQPWMFDDKEWHRIPRPKHTWHLLNYHVVAGQAKTQATPEQIRFFDYTFACMMQKEMGWH